MFGSTENKALEQKWAKILDLDGGIPDQHVRQTTARLLENQAVHILTEKSKSEMLNETTTVGTLGTFQKFAFPIVRRVFPELIANKICGVQPMQGPVSQVFYFGYDRSQNTSATAQAVYGKYLNVYRGNFPGSSGFPGGNITGIDTPLDGSTFNASDVTGAGDFAPSATVGGNIAMFPDTTSLLQFTTSAGEAMGQQVNVTTTTSAGLVSTVSVTLQNNIPDIDFHIETQSVEAGTRKFRALWTIEAAQDLRAYHNVDLEKELTTLLSKEVELEIDRELLEDMRMIAYDVNSTRSSPFAGFRRGSLDLPHANNFTGLTGEGTSGYQWDHIAGLANAQPAGTDKNVYFIDFGTTALPFAPQHVGHTYSNLLATLNFASNDIYKTTYKGPGNWFVCSPLVAALLESASKLEGGLSPDSYTNGVSYAGKFAKKYDVYIDPLWPEDEILMGWKGGTPMDAGFVYAPYIPLQMLPTVTDPESFQPRKGLITRYGKVAISPESRYYRIIRIVGANASNYLTTPFQKNGLAFGTLAS